VSTNATPTIDHSLPVADGPHVHVDPSSPWFWWYIVIIIAFVLLGGLFSGLTLGLMGLDSVRFDSCLLSESHLPSPLRVFLIPQVNLQVLSQSGTPDEQRQAPKVLSLLRSGRHTMLVVLLLGESFRSRPIQASVAR
jgi:metal transporter CNNM